ncbi:MAG: AAA family ATPase [Nitrospira sp.]|nr:AAA family ATPase [Nitrospira sp.]
MYETHYHLKAKPFTLVPDPGFLYLGAKHKAALSLLEYGLANGAAFIVIAGEPGTGKTTLLNRLLDETRHPWTIGVLSNTHTGFRGLLPWIGTAFDLQLAGMSETDAFQKFSRFLEQERDAGRRVLLVVDEAQNMGPAMLEELRLLSNLNDGRRRSLQIVLSGQLGLQELLKGPGLVQLAQRIGVEYLLDSLSEEETIAYIAHRLEVAGRETLLFTTLAGRYVFRLSGGTPRLINQLCDHALVYGFASQAETITARIVLDAAAARDRHAMFPFKVAPESLKVSVTEVEEERSEVQTLTVLNGQSQRVVRLPHGADEQDPAALYDEAVALKKASQLKKAITLFDRLAERESWAVKALAQKGLCLKAMGRYEDAFLAMREAARLQPVTEEEGVAVRYLLARTLESQGLCDEAREVYVALDQGQRKYRDVSARLAQLQNKDQDGEPLDGEPVTRFAAFWRGCGQLFRGMQS